MANFKYTPVFPNSVTNSAPKFERKLQHVDWVDGQDLVQAGDSPGGRGINGVIHTIEADFAAVKADLANAHQLIAELRLALATALNQIADELNKKIDLSAKPKEQKDGKDTKEGKDSKEAKDGKETKENKDGKEGKDTKEHKDGKEGKEGKEHKDGKEHVFKEKDGPHEILRELSAPPPSHLLAPDGPQAAPVGRSFIRPEERPAIGQALVRRDESPAG